MNKKHRALYIFLSIVTLGIFNLAIRKKKVIKENNLELNQELPIKPKSIINLVGGSKNISSVEARMSKLRINFVDKNLIEAEKLKSIKAVSGIIIQSQSVSLIVGYAAQNLAKAIKEEINE